MIKIYQKYIFKKFTIRFLVVLSFFYTIISSLAFISEGKSLSNSLLTGVSYVDDTLIFVFAISLIWLLISLIIKRELIIFYSSSLSKFDLFLPILIFIAIFSIFYMFIYRNTIRNTALNILSQNTTYNTANTVREMFFREDNLLTQTFSIFCLRNVTYDKGINLYHAESVFIITNKKSDKYPAIDILNKSNILLQDNTLYLNNVTGGKKYSLDIKQDSFKRVFVELLTNQTLHPFHKLPYIIKDTERIGLQSSALISQFVSVIQNVIAYFIISMASFTLLFNHHTRSGNVINKIITILLIAVLIMICDNIIKILILNSTNIAYINIYIILTIQVFIMLLIFFHI